MAQRGPKSSASLSVIRGGAASRPDAPAELTGTEAEVWTKTVAGEPADFFQTPAVQQLLVDYCRHVVAGQRLSRGIEKQMSGELDEKTASLRELDQLLKMRDRETRATGDVATKLRLTNQSRYRADVAGTAAKNAPKAKPWNYQG